MTMIFAVIATGGKQYLVKPGDKLNIEKLNLKEGEEFEFDKVLLVKNQDGLKIGQTQVDVKVRAKVLEQGRGEKTMVFRFKSKTRYKKKKGHRQPFTRVEILEIKD